MNKEELSEKRKQAIKSLNDVGAILGLDEMYIDELEKENAELKKRVENQKFFLERIRAKFELGEIDRKEIEGYLESEQLTKAKEIIRNLIESMQPIKFEEDRQRAIAKAEQFLNNSEVEK